jgi:hypothetical protein
MSQLTAASSFVDASQLEKLSVSIRGKLQFMDYLVRAAVADVERFHDETDAGTRIFIRQLIEMHASNLTVEGESMHLVNDFCSALESALHGEGESPSHENGDTE